MLDPTNYCLYVFSEVRFSWYSDELRKYQIKYHISWVNSDERRYTLCTQPVHIEGRLGTPSIVGLDP